MSKKKVLTSGCFDLLHSGHVEFFHQASLYGDLYVRLGTDSNIRMLKHHEPMYDQNERLFMVKSIRYVYDAGLSIGNGRFDFFEDIIEIQPDIYYCNEDASELSTRIQFCQDHHIQVVIAPRIPSAGLVERSSTSIKEHLKQIKKNEKNKEKQQQQPNKDLMKSDITMYNDVFPWRFCLAGGWMDLKWCNELHSGSVITINIKFHPGICKDMCGLATSSRRVAIDLWNGRLPTHLHPITAAKYLYGSENFHHFGEHWPTSIENINDMDNYRHLAIFQWLETVLYVVEIPFISRPGNYNSQKVNYVTDTTIPLEQRKLMVKALADASNMSWEGICSMNTDLLGQGLSDTMRAWAAMLPCTVDPYSTDTSSTAGECDTSDAILSYQLREFWKKYDRPYTKGCLFSGAGGGFLFVISDTVIEGGMKMNINHDHICKPFLPHELLP